MDKNEFKVSFPLNTLGLPKCMHHDVADAHVRVMVGDTAAKCRRIDECITIVGVCTDDLRSLTKCLDFTRAHVEIPPMLHTLQLKLLEALNRSLRNVAFAMQEGDGVVLHLYGLHRYVVDARLTAYRIINSFLGNTCVAIEGYFVSEELVSCGHYPFRGSRINSRQAIVVPTGSACPHAFQSTPFRDILDVDAARFSYLLYYKKPEVEDILALFECYLEVDRKIEIVYFDANMYRSCVREIKGMYFDIVKMKVARVIRNSNALCIESQGRCTLYCWADSAIRILESESSMVEAVIYLDPCLEEILGNKKDLRLQYISQKSGCSIYLRDTMNIVGKSTSVSHALDLLKREKMHMTCFFVDERKHKRLIGHGGKNIQKIMKKHGVYIKFMNEAERNSIGMHGNVIVKTSGRNPLSLECVKDELTGKKDEMVLRLITLFDFIGSAHCNYKYMYDCIVVFDGNDPGLAKIYEGDITNAIKASDAMEGDAMDREYWPKAGNHKELTHLQLRKFSEEDGPIQ